MPRRRSRNGGVRPGEPARVLPQVSPRKQSFYVQPGAGPHKRVWNDDIILNTRPATIGYGYPGGLYDDLLDHDNELQSFKAQRFSAITAANWDYAPGEDTKKGRIAASFISAALENGVDTSHGDQGLRRDVSELLDAVLYGWAVSEAEWAVGPFSFPDPGPQSKSKSKKGSDEVERPPITIPECRYLYRLLSRQRADFGFDDNGEPLYISRTQPAMGMGDPVPPQSHVFFRPYARYEDPYGYAKLKALYWLAWMKRNLIEFAMRDVQKYGSPSIIAELPEIGNISDTDITALFNALKNIQHGGGMITPHGVVVKTIEGMMELDLRGNYEWLICMCNDGMAKNIIGQTLTTSAGESGSQSLGLVHERVAAEIRQEDARAIEALMNGTIIKWMIDNNLPGYPYPRLVIDTADPKNLLNESQVDTAIAAIIAPLGMMLDLDDLQERYGREIVPIPQEILDMQEQKAEKEAEIAAKSKGDVGNRGGAPRKKGASESQ